MKIIILFKGRMADLSGSDRVSTWVLPISTN